MLAYPIPEAETLLEEKLDTARKGLSTCEEDLDFLREQITVSRAHCRHAELRMTLLILLLDARGCYGKSVQLGRRSETEGESSRSRLE